MKEQLTKALLAHANGEIAKHKANVEIYLANPVGIGDHPDIIAAIEHNLDEIAKYHDRIVVLKEVIK